MNNNNQNLPQPIIKYTNLKFSMEIQRYKKRIDKKKKKKKESLVIYKLSYHHIKVKWNVLALFLFINIYMKKCVRWWMMWECFFLDCVTPQPLFFYIYVHRWVWLWLQIHKIHKRKEKTTPNSINLSLTLIVFILSTHSIFQTS